MEEKKLMPGDRGYKGGTFNTTVYINGKSYNCHTVKDSNGNILYEGISPKFLGIF